MRAYADSSFLVKLITRESGTDAAVSEYRRLRLPRLFYVPLHALEVESAVRQRAFHQRKALASRAGARVSGEKAAALSRLKWMLDRGQFLEVAADWDDVVQRAGSLSEKHTESRGARSVDLLHVAFALELECEVFLTTDNRQAQVAKAEGLNVVAVAEDD